MGKNGEPSTVTTWATRGGRLPGPPTSRTKAPSLRRDTSIGEFAPPLPCCRDFTDFASCWISVGMGESVLDKIVYRRRKDAANMDVHLRVFLR